MSKGFHELITDIIDRKYTRDSQFNTRVILKAYYSQSSDQRRSLTLDALGKLPMLRGTLTRERARQILKNFRSKDLKREIELLERSEIINNPVMKSNREDLASLRKIVEKIVNEINSFTKPIFSWHVQNRLITKGLVAQDLFLPVVSELVESFSIDTSFKIEEYKGQRLILDKETALKSITKDIVIYAGMAATHLGGACSFEALTGEKWTS